MKFKKTRYELLEGTREFLDNRANWVAMDYCPVVQDSIPYIITRDGWDFVFEPFVPRDERPEGVTEYVNPTGVKFWMDKEGRFYRETFPVVHGKRITYFPKNIVWERGGLNERWPGKGCFNEWVVAFVGSADDCIWLDESLYNEIRQTKQAKEADDREDF